jgi:hypothetical protein
VARIPSCGVFVWALRGWIQHTIIYIDIHLFLLNDLECIRILQHKKDFKRESCQHNSFNTYRDLQLFLGITPSELR